MLAQGWIAEGSGLGVIGCVPVPPPPASVTISSPTRSPNVGDIMQLTAYEPTGSTILPAGARAW